MKLFFAIVILLSAGTLSAQEGNPEYDSTLAQSLGADDYGMKPYVFVMLKSGTNNIEDKAKRDSVFAGHLSNIRRLVDEKKLIVAGPLFKNDKSYRGIFIFDVDSIEEAEKLLETDPALNSGVLDADLYKWYGSAALPVYLETSNKIWKITP